MIGRDEMEYLEGWGYLGEPGFEPEIFNELFPCGAEPTAENLRTLEAAGFDPFIFACLLPRERWARFVEACGGLVVPPVDAFDLEQARLAALDEQAGIRAAAEGIKLDEARDRERDWQLGRLAMYLRGSAEYRHDEL